MQADENCFCGHSYGQHFVMEPFGHCTAENCTCKNYIPSESTLGIKE